jgi:hypothetical protein
VNRDLWEDIAFQLDISNSLYEDAVERYQAVGAFLSRPDSELGPTDVSPQGSFALGTVTKPVSDDEEYDIDLIARTEHSKYQITQLMLKQKAGNEIRAYHHQYGFEAPVTESETCWTLEYADTATFKMDIVPAVPDSAIMMLQPGSSPIAITDTTSPTYRVLDPGWTQSNPSGFAAWFRSRMLLQLNERRSQLAIATGKSVDQVPEYQVKTSLQRVVQLLKRLRNTYFAEQDFVPSSMVLTTIAGLLYKNEPTVTSAFISIIQRLNSVFIWRNGKLWLANPVDPSENLIEGWTNDNLDKFLAWCGALQATLLPAIEGKTSSAEQRQTAARSFGDRIVEKACQGQKALPSGKDSGNAAVRQLNKLPEIFRVRHRKFPRGWSFRYDHNCVVSAHADLKNERIDLVSDGAPLPKKVDLHFEVMTDAPPPYRVYYQVVNTGKEARLANGLRGGITVKTDCAIETIPHKESTLYSGSHYIEFFILKGTRCIARSGPFIVNIS